MIRITAPLRIDIGGGVTDIPEFASAVGTSVLNIGIDLFEDKLYSKPLIISVELKESTEPQILLQYNGDRLNLQITDNDPFFFIKSFVNAVLPEKKNFEICIQNNLPKGTGLGGSGCLSVLLTAIFSSNLEPSSIIKAAHRTEVEKLGIKGGFQDFIGAYYGKLNFITVNNLEEVDFSMTSTLGMELNPEIKKYLDDNMIIVVRKEDNIPSEVVVTDQVLNYKKNKKMLTRDLQMIKESNAALFSTVQSDLEINNKLIEIGVDMQKSWEAQKRLSKYVCSGVLASVEQKIKPMVYGVRGPGAAGNSLFIICKNNKSAIIEALKPFSNEINTYFARINEEGIVKKII